MFRRNKYNAVKTFQYGRWWHSKLELRVYEYLLLLEKAKQISDIHCQVHVRFHTYDHGRVHMIPDFSCFDLTEQKLIYVEAKGKPTREWLRKKKAWAIAGPAPLHIYSGTWKYFKRTEIIIPKNGGKNGDETS